MKTVFAVTVYDSESSDTSVWKVFDCRQKAEEFVADIESDTNLNDIEEGWYVHATITEHTLHQGGK